ncbi:hypothetical protein C5F59_035935 [Streptomyces sp. QL37]|uniref:hypothetical protein n=1 Tax=Streptomyces sp. QL37 TaxID=2093747 RepID=UPI000CF232AF|nr:hypothetical protein [Streptomyces sp. QL37]
MNDPFVLAEIISAYRTEAFMVAGGESELTHRAAFMEEPSEISFPSVRDPLDGSPQRGSATGTARGDDASGRK